MKSTEILHVFGPHFFGGKLPEFLEAIYKIDTGSDHVTKFRGDRPRELGDYALKIKEKKHHEHFIRPPVTPYGRPNESSVMIVVELDVCAQLRTFNLK